MNDSGNTQTDLNLPEFFGRRINKPTIQRLLSNAQGENVNAQTYQRNLNSYTDYDVLAKGVAVFIQNLIVADFNRTSDPKNPFNLNYNNPPIESVEYIQFSVDSISIKNDEYLNILVSNNSIPHVADIYKFLKYLKHALDFIPPNLILTCIYLKRICEIANIPLNILNYRLLFLVTLILAQKIWMEPYKQTKEFAIIFPDSYNQDQLRIYERDLLNIIYHNTKIEPSDYGNVCQILKDLSNDIVFITTNLDNDIQSNTGSNNSAIAPSVHSDTANNILSNQSIHSYSNNTFKLTSNLPNDITKNLSIYIPTTINSDITSNTAYNQFVNILSNPIYKLNCPLKGDVVELKMKGFTYDQIKSNDYTIYDFIHSGCQIPDLIDAKFTLTDLLTVRKETNDSNGNIVETNYFSIKDLKARGGFEISDFTVLGFTLNDLKYAGYLAKDYIAGGITIQTLIQNGYTVDDLIRLKFTPLQLDGFLNQLGELNEYNLISKEDFKSLHKPEVYIKKYEYIGSDVLLGIVKYKGLILSDLSKKIRSTDSQRSMKESILTNGYTNR